MKNSNLYNRIKNYEMVYKYKLLPNMYTILRLDGCHFSQYTKNLPKPFYRPLVQDMISTTKYLCEDIQGVKLAYTQSDEISLLLTDLDTYETQGWFDNEIQKMVSVSASLATGYFNSQRMASGNMKLAQFDSRVFQLPNLAEVKNYFLQRQQDFYKNSISGCAQVLYSHNQLHGKNSSEKQELIFQKGELLKEKLRDCGYLMYPFPDKNYNWNDLPGFLKRGTTVFKSPQKKYFTKEIFDKDKRSEQVKLSTDWGKEESPIYPETHHLLSETKYYKIVNQWTTEAIDFSEPNDRIFLTL